MPPSHQAVILTIHFGEGRLAVNMDVGLVCDSCSAFCPMGASACVRCGTGVSLDAGAPVVAPAAAVPTCSQCRAPLSPGHRFCFNCGARVGEEAARPAPRASTEPSKSGPSARSTMYFGAVQAARAKLTVIRGDGLDGVSFSLAGDEHLVGREDCPIAFADDSFLSPQHASFFYREGTLFVRDEESVNGVFVRISGTTLLGLGASFLVGEQLLTLLAYGPIRDDAEADGTYFYASPRRPGRFRLAQALRGGGYGRTVVINDNPVTLGREGNDLDFPDDPFISGRHAEVTPAGENSVTLADRGSRNGTFVRVQGEHLLNHGDYVFIGQQLLRVEIV